MASGDEMPDAATTATVPAKHFYDLDSLRGFAALSVVLHHYVTLRFTHIADPGMGRFTHIALLLLRPICSGREAVTLFFILSGFVLSLPYLQNKPLPYSVFMGRRILRIYCPYLFALALAVAGASMWHGSLGLHWPTAWSDAPTLHLVLQNVLLIGIYDVNQLNSVTWTLIHQMRIWIVFPFLFLLVNRMGTLSVLFLAACCSILGIAASGPLQHVASLWRTLHYVAFFMLGIVLARNEVAISSWFRSLRPWYRRAFFAATFLVFSYAGLLWTFLERHIARRPDMILDWPAALGSAGYIVLALNSAILRRLMLLRAPLFLGRISYSLYLTHWTVMMVMLFVFQGRLPLAIEFSLYLASCLLLATGFYYLVERPFVRWNRGIGRQPAGRSMVRQPEPATQAL